MPLNKPSTGESRKGDWPLAYISHTHQFLMRRFHSLPLGFTSAISWESPRHHHHFSSLCIPLSVGVVFASSSILPHFSHCLSYAATVPLDVVQCSHLSIIHQQTSFWLRECVVHREDKGMQFSVMLSEVLTLQKQMKNLVYTSLPVC